MNEPGTALGAVLAGGRGSRLGGAKATARAAGRPLLAWSLDALRAAVPEVVVIAKEATPLPPCDAPVHRDEPPDFHPRHGLVSALRRAAGRPVVVVPCDMPLVPPALLEVLLDVVEDGAPAAIPRTEGRLHPLCAAYAPGVLRDLEAAGPDEPLTLTLDRLGATVLDADAAADRMLNVNTRADLAVAELLLRHAR
ncbi:MAG TPA: molybdenum cofactor guanylyltransferase [Solirubrobacteraceae bacterium]|nr:molybdenum cofactor guanylyltransferase [Solirubrobacteraceae bacterium]